MAEPSVLSPQADPRCRVSVVPLCQASVMTGTVTTRGDADRVAERVACCRHPQPASLVVHPVASGRRRCRDGTPAVSYPCIG